MQTVLSFGKVAYSGAKANNEVTINISLQVKNRQVIDYDTLQPIVNAPVFSVSGDIWDSRKTDIECGGQCIDTIMELIPNNPKIKRIHDLWEQYHLNDMQADTKKQVEAIAAWRKETNTQGFAYTEESEYLKSINLFEDNGIKWGHQWLYMPIPAEILAEIELLQEIN